MIPTDSLTLFTGLFVGMIGMALLIYGKKQQQFAPAIAGIVLSVLPFVIASALVLIGATAACLGGLYVISREG